MPNINQETADIAQALITGLDAAGLPFHAERVRGCGHWFKQWRCDACGERDWSMKHWCNVKLCPWCSRARVARLYGRYGDALQAITRPRMITLTVRNIPEGELRYNLRRFSKCLSRFWEKFLKAKSCGACVATEVTYNRDTRTWHPHAHLVYDGDFIAQAELANAWRKASEGWGYVVDIRELRGNWARELLKYVGKSAEFADRKNALFEFVKGTTKFRFWRTWGRFYKIPEPEEGDVHERKCPKCGTLMVLEEDNVALESILKNWNGVFGEAGERPEYHPPPKTETEWWSNASTN